MDEYNENLNEEVVNKSTNLNDKDDHCSADLINLNKPDKPTDFMNNDLNISQFQSAKLKSLIKEDNRLLSHSAPNLVSSSSPLTSGEYTEQFIRKNLDLFNKFHNLEINQECSLEPIEDPVLFDQNAIKQLNKNAIDFLKNFSAHKQLHRFDTDKDTDELNEDNLINYNEVRKRLSSQLENDLATNLINNSINDLLADQLVNYSLKDEFKHSICDDYVKVDLNNKNRSNTSFLYTNNEDLIRSIDVIEQKNVDINSHSSQLRRSSKVLFSKEEEPDLVPSSLPTNYSVASILEQNDYEVNDIHQMTREIKRSYLFKILIMGDSNTGKTSFVRRFTSNTSPRNYLPTVGLEFSMKIIQIDEQREIKLQLYDLSGEKNQNSLSKLYFRDASGCLVFFDCSRESSFKSVNKWKEQLDANARLFDGSKLPTILICNKCDLKREAFCKDEELIKKFCRQAEFNEYFFTSAKTNQNIKESIECLIKLIFESRMEFFYNQTNVVKLEDQDSVKDLTSRFKCFC